MTQEEINGGELRDFVETHKLRNRFSLIHFNALVSITTAKNTVNNKRIEIMMSFDNYNSYGDLKFLDGGLDPHLYPTVFDAKWPKIEHNFNELIITDIHTRNPDIGKYIVKITPLDKIEN